MFVDELDLEALNFDSSELEATGRPACKRRRLTSPAAISLATPTAAPDNPPVRQLKSITLLITLLMLSACGFHGSEMKGIVEEVVNFDAPPDQWKYVPIANAEVMVLWYGQTPTPIHSSSVCLRAIYTKSGPDGRFDVPGWWRSPFKEPAAVDVHPVSYAFVPGFEQLHTQTRGDRIWMPGPGVHVMRRLEPGEVPRLRENAFINAQWCPESREASAREQAATTSPPPSAPEETAKPCPMICLNLEYGQGCVGGCVSPASSTSPAVVDGKQVEAGFWLRGSGADGAPGSDLQFEALIRQPGPNGLIECSIKIDGRVSGDRTEMCTEPLGAVHVTVEEIG